MSAGDLRSGTPAGSGDPRRTPDPSSRRRMRSPGGRSSVRADNRRLGRSPTAVRGAPAEGQGPAGSSSGARAVTRPSFFRKNRASIKKRRGVLPQDFPVIMLGKWGAMRWLGNSPFGAYQAITMRGRDGQGPGPLDHPGAGSGRGGVNTRGHRVPAAGELDATTGCPSRKPGTDCRPSFVWFDRVELTELPAKSCKVAKPWFARSSPGACTTG